MTIGKFVWYDLMTTDTKAAEAFYGEVIGWKVTDAGMPGRYYGILHAGDKQAGGLMPVPDDAKGMPPMWMGYIGVDDVDAYCAKVISAGGKIYREAQDIPGVGRFAVAADPHGAGFILFHGTGGVAPDPANQMLKGHVGWNELHAGDWAEAWAFYAKLFGWTKSTAMDMGPMGTYQLFKTGDAHDAGGIMTKMKEAPVPFWHFYFNVEDIDAAAARITKAGGKILNGPMEVPGPMWVITAFDPQGAVFAVVGKRVAKETLH